ncbi:MAG: hypothetical protein CSA76_07130, partial [Spirochaetales bacterium]
WWSSHSEAAGGYRNSKHIFVGSERVVTSQSVDGSGYGWTFEDHNSYWYHPDHLGSTALVTDSRGLPYERMDYLAYGQSWVEKKYERPPDGSSGNGKIYHRFTSKEWDEETGLYAFPKRYYEPRLARWMSVDPAGFELASPMERGQNGALQPKSGYSVIEALNHYSYCSNNPILYTDPTGEQVFLVGITSVGGAGTGISYEMGVALSKTKDGKWEVGTYQTSGGGFYAGYGGSISLSITWFPKAQKIDDVKGTVLTVGGAGKIAGPISGGIDLNIPLDSPIMDFSFTGNIGLSGGTPEGHAIPTISTVQVRGSGESLKEAWKAGVDSGMLDDMPKEVIEMIKEHFKQVYLGVDQQKIQAPVNKE